MGSGVVFTTTPLAVEPEAYITPEVGEDLFVEPFKAGAAWFSPYEDMDIEDNIVPAKPQSLRAIVPDDGIDAPPEDEEAHNWRVLESEPFSLKNKAFTSQRKTAWIHLTELEIRVAMYSGKGTS